METPPIVATKVLPSELVQVPSPGEQAAPKARAERLLRVTRRLIILTFCGLACLAVIFAVTLLYGNRFMVSWACFACGLLGGFVSIQQRLKNFGDEELGLLSQSWFQILLIPIYGGIFAGVLYVAFLSNVIEGPLFPKFAGPPFSQPIPSTGDIRSFFSQTYPVSGSDLAKLLFWSFVAGFSERFVPQIIERSQTDATSNKG